ncbi:MAG: DGQHR domain-containing protein [Gemmatimonadetes bacterium]|nr:DGQHR domain-containing protein [Gemmatimonadota bacterium]
MTNESNRKPVPALKVRQWLANWDEIHWDPDENRAEPRHWFYQFSMAAADLKALSGVYARTTDRTTASEDMGIQRRHERGRSEEIQRFVKFGYPWSVLSEAKRNSGNFEDLRQPGWLPTSIVVNILTPEDKRRGQSVSTSDLVEIEDGDNGVASVLLPESFNSKNWKPENIPPIEVIDGQHRLWAFETQELEGDYELPVVAFVGLDLSWQAYLFYTINIKPKKINASLAFDLYPLLRTEEWLSKFEGHAIYRETRAQELVDSLYSHPESPWHRRINMLGESGSRGLMVTQAAWVRSLLASFIKTWEGPRVQIGGLFGSTVGRDETVLPWNFGDQSAFLIVMGQMIQKAIAGRHDPWIEALRGQEFPSLFQETGDFPDLAFFGQNTLMNQDQGIRTLLQVVNDLCFVRADELKLSDWGGEQEEEERQAQTTVSIRSLRQKKEIIDFLKELSDSLATYDWRASSGPGLTEEERTRKAAFRGSGGYKELRKDVLEHLLNGRGPVALNGQGPVAQSAREVLLRLGY